MKGFVTAGCAVLAALSLTLPAHAATARVKIPSSTAHVGVVAFQLRVQGNPGTRSAFWVAYGPLAGRFGVIRLHTAGRGFYSASVQLPLARTQYTYLQSQGVLHTAHGDQPAGHPVTIRQVGPVVLRQGIQPTVQWQAPIG